MQNVKNKHWKVRKHTIQLLKSGWSQSKVARYLGYYQSTISRWRNKWFWHGQAGYHNFSNKPKTLHPKTTLWEHQLLVRKIRKETRYCHQKIQMVLAQEHQIHLSLSTIYRILKKSGLIKSKQRYQRAKKQIPVVFRPKEAGKLIQLDTKHLKDRYQYVFIDCATRYPVAYVSTRLDMQTASSLLKQALKDFPFKIEMIQTDNGPEFQSKFVKICQRLNLSHRYSRIRKSQDNAIVERMHRTIDEEFYYQRKLNVPVSQLNLQLQEYLIWFREKRIHLGLQGLTPQQKLEELKTMHSV